MSEEEFKRRLTAILSADVEGYSLLMRDDEEATIRTLKIYRAAIRDLVRQYRGRVVDSPGDNIMAEFASVLDAVNCAVEIQRELAERNTELPDDRKMLFRIGVNLGDIVEDGERIYGDGVNIAARMESLAEGGGICISGKVYEEVKHKLGLEYEFQGEQEVKNIPEPVRVYKVLSFPGAAAHRVAKAKRAVGKRWRNAIVAIVGVILAVAVVAVWNFYFRSPSIEPASVEKMAYPLPDKPSIAVLPFVNMSGDPKQEYFSDGLTEEIISALSKVPKLFVIARNSTFTYKGKPVKVQQVSEELGVRYVLEGGVRKAEDRVRITAQLIDALSGHHMWSERYDRNLKDIFAIQDEITMKIITALQVELTAGEEARLWSKGTHNLKAYLKFLQARELALRQTKDGNIEARRIAEEAIKMDPDYANSYRILAFTHMMDVWLQTTKSPKQSIKQAIELSKKAITLDDSNAIAHGLLGWLYTMTRQHDKGVAEAKQGVALDPNGSSAHEYLGIALRYAGRFEEATPVIEKAIRLNPFPTSATLRSLCLANIGAGKYEEAIAAGKRAITISPDDFLSHVVLAAAYSLAGEQDRARAETEEVLRIIPNYSLEYFEKTLPFKNKADFERLIGACRMAGLPDKPPLPLPDKPSIAVLPFVNMSGDPKQEYFSDGLSEEIITALSKTPNLFVIARTSSFKYKGKEADVRTVGRELGVRYVLEGSVRKAGDKVRVTAQLIDAQTNQHLWAERYDRDLKDIFVIQDQITKKIITALQVKLTRGELARLGARKTDNLDAYLKYLEGIEQIYRYNKEGNLLARQKAEEAISLDPEYPAAYALLAMSHLIDVWFKWSNSSRESITRAFELAKKVLELDESQSGAHRVLSHIYLLKKQHDKAIAECERAVSLAPNLAENWDNLGLILRFSGRAKEAISMHERAIRLNPMPPAAYLYKLAICHVFTGEFEKAIAICRKALTQNPDDLAVHLTLAMAYSLADRKEEARAEVAEVLRIHPNFTVGYAAKTWPYKNQADIDLIVKALSKAGLK